MSPTVAAAKKLSVKEFIQLGFQILVGGFILLSIPLLRGGVTAVVGNQQAIIRINEQLKVMNKHIDNDKITNKDQVRVMINDHLIESVNHGKK